MPVIGVGYVWEVEVQFRGIAWLGWTFSVLTTCRWCYDWILLCHGTTSKTILINSIHPRKTCELASWTDLWKKVWSQCLAGSSCSLTVVCFTAKRGQNASWSTVKEWILNCFIACNNLESIIDEMRVAQKLLKFLVQSYAIWFLISCMFVSL